MRLILASESPRRQALLRQCGIDFEVVPANVPEVTRKGEKPEETVLRLSREKALMVARYLRKERAIVLAADTVVADGDQILGKPSDRDQAREFLDQLRGREHRVLTGVCLLETPGGVERTDLSITRVRMRDYSPEELETYVDSGDGMDKAGAYAIQHQVFRPVKAIDGCYANVVGLPLCRVYGLLEAAGERPARPLPEGCRTGGACAFAELSD
jgi:MAF protein